MKKLTEKQIDETRALINPKEMDGGNLYQMLKSLPREEALKLVKMWDAENKANFPKLADKMVKFGLLTREEFEKEWNDPDMHDVFLYILLGKIQEAKKAGHDINMVSTSKFMLEKRQEILDRFGIKIVDPKEAVEKIEKLDPEGIRESRKRTHHDRHSTDYIG